MFNARLYDERGAFIAMVDAWWERAGVAVEVDSRAYHSRAKDQDRTADRHAELVDQRLSWQQELQLSQNMGRGLSR